MEKPVLLLQIRKNPDSILQEQTCFFRVTGLKNSRFVIKNILTETVGENDLNGIGAVIIGGSGEYAGSDNFENVESLEMVVKAARKRGIPILGVCFGAQFLARVFGGEVVQEDEKQELGTFEIVTTEAGLTDPIFSKTPPTFYAQEAHNFYIKKPPPEAVILARSEKCPVQAFRFPGSVIYGILFHPEMTSDDAYARISKSQGYAKSSHHMKSILASLRKTPEAAKVVGLFLNISGISTTNT